MEIQSTWFVKLGMIDSDFLGLQLFTQIGCQPDEPLDSLATTNRIINVYGFLVVVMLLMYFVFQCLYSVENKITTTIIIYSFVNDYQSF